jgi:hypothetical protein
MTDPDLHQLPALDDLRHQLVAVARADSRRPVRRSPRRIVVAVAAIVALAVPAGFAIAEVTSDGDAVPASACPDANAALREAGLPVPDQYSPGCPSADELHDLQRVELPADASPLGGNQGGRADR